MSDDYDLDDGTSGTPHIPQMEVAVAFENPYNMSEHRPNKSPCNMGAGSEAVCPCPGQDEGPMYDAVLSMAVNNKQRLLFDCF